MVRMVVSKTSDVGPIPAVPAIILIEFNSFCGGRKALLATACRQNFR